MTAPDPTPRVSVPGAFGSLLGSLGRDVRDLFRNPAAVSGGLGGTAFVTGLLALLFFVVLPAAASQAGEAQFEIEFTPGTLTLLGEDIPEPDLPEKVVVRETRPEEETVQETVTELETAVPKPDEPKEIDRKPKKVDRPFEPKDPKLPKSKLPTRSNTPFKDLPTASRVKGDPFGDPQGWDKLRRDGDKWATDVMKALNNMGVQSFAGDLPAGTYKFTLEVCKDGKIDNVRSKGGTIGGDGQSKVLTALEQLQVPPPPRELLSKIRGRCAKIKHTFTWSSSGGRSPGRVR